MSCPKWAAFSHAWYWSKGKRSNISQWHFGCFHSFVQTTTDWLYSLYSSLFDSIYLIPDTNSWFWKMQPLWDRERGRKICERGVPGNFYLAQPPYIHIIIYSNYNLWYRDVDHMISIQQMVWIGHVLLLNPFNQVVLCSAAGMDLSLRFVQLFREATWLVDWRLNEVPRVYLTHPTRKTVGNCCNSGCYLCWMEQTPAI